MNVRLSSTAPEFPVAKSEPQTSVVTKWTSSHLNFPSQSQNHKLRLWRTSRRIQKLQPLKTTHSSALLYRLIQSLLSLFPNVQLLSTVSFAFQIPNLHSANIWTLVQIWTLSKYSGECFDSFLKSKHFDSFLFYSFFSIPRIKTVTFCNVLFPKIKCPTDFARPCRSLVDPFDFHHRLLSTDWDNVTLQRHKGRTLRTYHSAYVLTFCYSD